MASPTAEGEVQDVVRGVNRIRSKASTATTVKPEDVRSKLESDAFLTAGAIKARIDGKNKAVMATSSTKDAIETAYGHFGLEAISSKTVYD